MPRNARTASATGAAATVASRVGRRGFGDARRPFEGATESGAPGGSGESPITACDGGEVMRSKPPAHLLRAQLSTPAPMPGTREKMSMHTSQSVAGGAPAAARAILAEAEAGAAFEVARDQACRGVVP